MTCRATSTTKSPGCSAVPLATPSPSFTKLGSASANCFKGAAAALFFICLNAPAQTNAVGTAALRLTINYPPESVVRSMFGAAASYGCEFFGVESNVSYIGVASAS